MNSQQYAHVADRGKIIRVPAAVIEGHTVVGTGRLITTARILDEEFVEGDLVSDPKEFIAQLCNSSLKADVLTFPQKIYEETPRHAYPFEWDNAAVAKTESFDEWWTKLPQESRKNARRAVRRGVVVETVGLDDALIRGIKSIYDEMPVRQGKKFWHYGKDLETIKRENSTFAGRSEFIGAFHGTELIGFMKFVYVDGVANMMQILSKAAHYDKKPMNALIAKAVEVCSQQRASYLVYSKFTYGNKEKSQLSEFKRRNGFVQMDYPRYFVPLTWLGESWVRFRLHRGLLGLLPAGVIDVMWRVRASLQRTGH
jgi:hypothetical protein